MEEFPAEDLDDDDDDSDGEENDSNETEDEKENKKHQGQRSYCLFVSKRMRSLILHQQQQQALFPHSLRIRHVKTSDRPRYYCV